MDQYRCPKCENTVPAQRVDRRVPGSKHMVRLTTAVVCEKDGSEMVREAAPVRRREVSSHY